MAATPTTEIESRSTTSSPNNGPPIAAGTELWILLSRTKSTSTKTKLKSILTFGAKKPIPFVKIEAILTSELQVREFMKSHIGQQDRQERYEVDVCYAGGERVMEWNEDTGRFDDGAKGVRIVDKKEKIARDVWVQRVKYLNEGRVVRR